MGPWRSHILSFLLYLLTNARVGGTLNPVIDEAEVERFWHGSWDTPPKEEHPSGRQERHAHRAPKAPRVFIETRQYKTRMPFISLAQQATSFAAQTATASVVVMSLCSDDVLWLLPFMVNKNWRSYAIAYVLYAQLVCFIAYCFMLASTELEHLRPKWHIKLALEGASAFALATLALSLFVQWALRLRARSAARVERCPEEGDCLERAGGNTSYGAAASLACASPDPAPDVADAAGQGAAAGAVMRASKEQEYDPPEYSHSQFFMLCVMGNLGNLVVYIPLLIERTLPPQFLFLGVFLTTLLVLAVDRGLGQLRSVADIVSHIPLWVIAGCLAAKSIRCVASEIAIGHELF